MSSFLPGLLRLPPNHVSGIPIESVADLSGAELVKNVWRLLDDRRPLGLSLVGGEPLVRVREISLVLPEMRRRGIEVEIVTSGAIPPTG